MRRSFIRLGATWLAALPLFVVAAACDADSDETSYLGTWDPVMLTPQGEVTVIPNGGISFRDDQVCFVRFSEECYDANYALFGDTIAVEMNADPTYYLLHTPFDGYLVVREMSDRPILYVRRQAE